MKMYYETVCIYRHEVFSDSFIECCSNLLKINVVNIFALSEIYYE